MELFTLASLVVLFKLMIAHAVCDFSLQTPPMAAGKNRHKKPQDDAAKYGSRTMWPYWLSAHALIQAGGVYLVTGDMRFAGIELAIHWWFDFAKCENWTNVHVDQLLHFAVKVGYVALMAFGI